MNFLKNKYAKLALIALVVIGSYFVARVIGFNSSSEDDSDSGQDSKEIKATTFNRKEPPGKKTNESSRNLQTGSAKKSTLGKGGETDNARLRIEDLPSKYQNDYYEAKEFVDGFPEIEQEIYRLNPHFDTAIRLREELKNMGNGIPRAELERGEKIRDSWESEDPENESKGRVRVTILYIDSYLKALEDERYSNLVEDQLGRGLPEGMYGHFIHGFDLVGLSTEGLDINPQDVSDLNGYRNMIGEMAKQLKEIPGNEEAFRAFSPEIENFLSVESMIYAKRHLHDYYLKSSVPDDVYESYKMHVSRLKDIERRFQQETPLEVAGLLGDLISDDVFRNLFKGSVYDQYLARPMSFSNNE